MDGQKGNQRRVCEYESSMTPAKAARGIVAFCAGRQTEAVAPSGPFACLGRRAGAQSCLLATK
ncbi:MAG: hypothetical protein U1E20_12200 [Methylocystis sp.]|uniref:hypothetical protein n=1 Tax=Methylocystis sp. TaxID=1911079 RepID=UPI00394D8F68